MLRVTRCTPVLASCWQSSETSTNSVFSERLSGWFCAIAIAVDIIADRLNGFLRRICAVDVIKSL